MKGDLVRGHLDMLLLATLQKDALHGYAVVEALRERSAGELDLPEGTIYPALHRLEASGLLASEWSIADGRRRRLYRITRDGRHALREHERQWRTVSQTIDALLKGKSWTAT